MDNVLVLEDYEPYRDLLLHILQKAFPDISTSEATTVAEASKLITSTYFDLALIDLNLPDGSGIEVIKELRAISPDTFCVVATVFDDDKTLFNSLKAGAHGYLLKDESRKNLLAHLKGILQGHPPLSSSMAKKMIRHFSVPALDTHHVDVNLSSREKEVLQLIAKGHPRKSIARELDISLHTANDHVKAVYRKLKVSSSVEATRIALDSGLAE